MDTPSSFEHRPVIPTDHTDNLPVIPIRHSESVTGDAPRPEEIIQDQRSTSCKFSRLAETV
jgi:hypothetical protein